MRSTAGADRDVHRTFLDYTAGKMDDPAAVERFRGLKSRCEAIFRELGFESRGLEVLDVGCGMGVQARLWAGDGHDVTAVDLDPGLLAAGRERARERGVLVAWTRATADRLPFPDGAFDVCLALELLEHVPHWRECLAEISRVVRAGGMLLLTTTNAICPRQHEFRLPLYSWWPRFLKRRMERLARTTRPELANYTAWPAVNWFTYWGLRRDLRRHGLEALDAFDIMDLSRKPRPVRWLVRAARKLPPLRAALYLLVPGTLIFARRP
jgi:2-polyprenyl-3-methyl-5-hydroxy-6-metoxy-1,4-benzoquinol methylase